ncbi:MAG: DMT family transporter [Pseudomonadota bacterium]
MLSRTSFRADSPNRNLEAAALMVVATACFVGMSSTVKVLAAEFDTAQIVWGRYATHFLLVLALLAASGRLAEVRTTARPGVQLARSLLIFAATVLTFIPLRYLQLAEVASIMFLTPMIVTGLAALVLGERVGPRRWAAVGVGLLGALVIVRPGLGAFHWAASVAVLAAFAYACYQILTRVVGDKAPPVVSLFYASFVGTAVSSAVVPFDWVAPDLAGWARLALAGLFAAGGHLAMTAALVRAQASFVTAFSYLQLLWATLVGFALFGDLPDGWTFAGALLIAGSGLYVLHRERLRRTTAECPPATRIEP